MCDDEPAVEPWTAIIGLGALGFEILNLIATRPLPDGQPCRVMHAASRPWSPGSDASLPSSTRLLVDEGKQGQEGLADALAGKGMVLLAVDPREVALAVETGKLARAGGALVVAFAPYGLAPMGSLRAATDTLVGVPAGRGPDIPHAVAESIADGILGLADCMLVHGFIGIDFSDYELVFGGHRIARMGIGWGAGERMAEDAATRAAVSPLLAGMPIKAARSVMLAINAGNDVTLAHINAAAAGVQSEARDDADMCFACVVSPWLEARFQVVLFAMGKPRTRPRPRRTHRW
jgi:hypothetical protein